MEREIISWLKSNIPCSDSIPIGIGDDAAIVQNESNRLVVTTDAIVDRVHFDLGEHSFAAVGHKAIGVNLSDLAAMGASPLACVVSLVLPHSSSLENVTDLYDGMRKLTDDFDMPIAGGDTNVADTSMVVSVTAFGQLVSDPWLLNGAKPGDRILVTGELGGSIIRKHIDFRPRCREAEYIANHFKVNAATDISDGFLHDLELIAGASGVGAEIMLSNLPVSADAESLSVETGRCPVKHALYDGEDFELILIADSQQADRMMADSFLANQLSCVGTIIEGNELLGVDKDGIRKRLKSGGYSH